MLLSLLTTVALATPSIEEPLRTGARSAADAAVVVGIEAYPFLPDVSHATRDADAAYNLMVYTVGIPAERVSLLKGGSREQILSAVRRAADQVEEGGTLWVWFAGHGAAGSTGDILLVGDDARPDSGVFEARSIPVSELTSGYDGVANVFLDACWAGRGRDGAELMPGTRFAVPTWVGARDERVRLWTAATESQLSGPYPAARHGLFTYFAVGALRGWADGEIDGKRDGVVTAEEAQAYVSRMLPGVQVRNQTPRWQGPKDAVLVTARGLERGPELTDLPPAMNTPAPAVIRTDGPGPVGLVPPIRYLGHKQYEDGARRSLTYDQLRVETRDIARVQSTLAAERTWKRTQALGWSTMGVGVLTSLVGLVADAVRIGDYNWDYDRHQESVALCQSNDFFCPADPEPTRPTTGRAPAIGAGIAGAGAMLVVGGGLGRKGVKRRVAKVATEELRR